MAKKKNDFESDIKELEKIVLEMEALDDNLDRAIDLYKDGIRLALNCSENLNKFEKEIFLLKEDFDNKINISTLEG